MKINIGKLISAIIKTAKATPTLVINAVSAIGPVIKAVKAEARKPKAP